MTNKKKAKKGVFILTEYISLQHKKAQEDALLFVFFLGQSGPYHKRHPAFIEKSTYYFSLL